jgi:5S rRNA maturation endonuclease (ribonuclease M5)
MSTSLYIPAKGFSRNRWTGLKQSHIPSCIVTDTALSLPTDALIVYVVLLYLHQGRMMALRPASRKLVGIAMVKVSQKKLMRYTGFSINKITSATKALQAYGLVGITHERKQSYGPPEELTAGTQDAKSQKKNQNSTTKANTYWPNRPDTIRTVPSGLLIVQEGIVKYLILLAGITLICPCVKSGSCPELIVAERGSSADRGNSTTIRQGGELMLKCPFHSDHTLSLSANTRKQGSWHCHGCKRSGDVYQLLAGLLGCSVGEAMIMLAATNGLDLEFQDPDAGATIYPYMTEDGKKILKEVLVRYKNGKKEFTQRRPGPRGYGLINDAEAVPPSLYHVELLKEAKTVCIVEGEKDADTVTNRRLGAPSNLVIGVTSGGANSWRPEFVRYFAGKNVVVMTDDDDAGRQCAADIKASLDAAAIPYREVTFGDVGCKDVSDFMLEHTDLELADRIGRDLIPCVSTYIAIDANEIGI